MYREMRRREKQLSEAEGIRLLKEGGYGVLSTFSIEGEPYGIPLNYMYDDGCIYFHSALAGRKVDILKNQNKVSFCVVGLSEVFPAKFSTRYESVILFGQVLEVFGTEKEKGLLGLIDKYSTDYTLEGKKYIENAAGITGVYKIEIQHMTAKSSRK